MALGIPTNSRRSLDGFTLIELLVAISVMALMAVMGWRALAGMQQATTQTRTHTDAVLTLEAGLAQWGTDLDALAELPFTTAVEWDGRALRITRSHSAGPNEGVLVVAWTRDSRDDAAQWLRWQSAPVRSRQEWQQAWAAAAAWAQSPSDAAKQREVAIAPLAQWQIYYYRGGAWSNPLSSSGAPNASKGTPAPAATPDGVRLVLTLSSPHPLAGTLSRDWARPTTGSTTP
ncbi:MAG: general secretion pathway protein J [Burkholderiales bacterium RIFCSPLOWO2_12_FULL_61_40]|nr:MAG: general secretion pathway protein J [Burkholderiales bacterium RIFCSPLOWO2_12_FULL_61_40]